MMNKRLLALLLVLALTMGSCASALAAEAARTLQSGMSGEDVLIAQNRMSRQTDQRDHLDLQVSLLAEESIDTILKYAANHLWKD